MPHAAINTGAVDFVLPLEEIAPALVTLSTSGQDER
jgi:chemotaxis response regulator CheB